MIPKKCFEILSHIAITCKLLGWFVTMTKDNQHSK